MIRASNLHRCQMCCLYSCCPLTSKSVRHWQLNPPDLCNWYCLCSLKYHGMFIKWRNTKKKYFLTFLVVYPNYLFQWSQNFCKFSALSFFLHHLTKFSHSRSAEQFWYQKSKYHSNIWQKNLCLLDKGIEKISKKLHSQDIFLMANQNRAKKCRRMGWIDCAMCYLADCSKTHRGISISCTIWNPLINMSYLTDSYISFTLKLESRQNFCSNMLIRSSTYGKKNISDFPPCGSHFLLIHFTY